MSNALQTITLPNPGLVDTWIIVNHCPADGEWDIKSVEFYADAHGEFCIGDYSMGELPRNLQEQIYLLLEAHKNTQHGLRRLLNDLRADAAGIRILEGARTQ